MITSRDKCPTRRANKRREAAQLLRLGRYRQAAGLYRQARQRPIEGDPALLALEEADALTGLGDHQAALDHVTRALRRRPREADVVARLRIQRAWCLWLLGRTALARREIERASQGASSAMTRARLAEICGWMAWKALDISEAQTHLANAAQLYEQNGHDEGVVRILEVEGALLRDAGRLDDALQTHARRIAMASKTHRLDAVARARADRGTILTVLGRWDEAREELERSATLFRELGDRREVTLAGVLLAVVDLAMGRPAVARDTIERAIELESAPGASPRFLAEDLLILVDAHLATGEPLRAEEACVKAARIFATVGDRGGECWAHLRRSQALLDLERGEDAMKAAQTALSLVPKDKVHLAAWAEMARGRILLRSQRGSEAVPCFKRALDLAGARPGLGAMARLGLALALGEEATSPAIANALTDLDAWGDRRLRDLCVRDATTILGSLPSRSDGGRDGLRVESLDVGDSALLVDAALSLVAGEGWTGALAAVRPALPWQRAVWAGAHAMVMTAEQGIARPLAENDVALDLCRRATAPTWIDFDCSHRDHPAVSLMGLRSAALAPLSDGSVLYADFTQAGLPAERCVALLTQVGRLIAGAGGPVDDGSDLDPDLDSDHCLVGSSPAMRRVLFEVARVAPTRLAVLICGETGTGKELVARAIHAGSPRASGPFKAINAASLEDGLFESQMFGHARGAFTGAERTTDGLVAAADGGTLFLDEVADLSPRAQAKLLRFLEDREYARLGETTARKADVRIISAANADLRERIREGGFRADLYYRLRGTAIMLPPLRQRGDDVVEIARHMLRVQARKKGRAVPPLPAAIARAFHRHSWPGNVRELAQEIERILGFAGDGPLRPEFLSPDILAGATTETTPASDIRLARRDYESRLIADTLDAHGGNRTRAARALGLSRQGLGLKMRQVGLA